MPELELAKQLAADADQCVKCGLCVPRCPTWIASGNEANSPRGRIMLMEAFARDGSLPAGGERYLDACLNCGLCEEICPSNVSYGRMIKRTMAAVRPRQTLLGRLLLGLAGKSWRAGALRILRTAARIGAPLARLLPPAWRMGLVWMRTPSTPVPQLQRAATTQGQVRLLGGCFASSLDNETLAATQSLLGACGWDVAEVEEQCCGAIYSQAGQDEQAENCAQRHQQLAANGTTLLTTSPACALELHERENYGDRVLEAGAFVLKHADQLPRLRPLASASTVFIHLPCTQQRLPGKGAWVKQLLEKIPQVQLRMLPGNEACCGAGGLRGLGHPATTAKLGERIATQARNELQPEDVIVSSNYACRCQLHASLQAAGLANRIIDPCSLLAQAAAA